MTVRKKPNMGERISTRTARTPPGIVGSTMQASRPAAREKRPAAPRIAFRRKTCYA